MGNTVNGISNNGTFSTDLKKRKSIEINEPDTINTTKDVEDVDIGNNIIDNQQVVIFLLLLYSILFA